MTNLTKLTTMGYITGLALVLSFAVPQQPARADLGDFLGGVVAGVILNEILDDDVGYGRHPYCGYCGDRYARIWAPARGDWVWRHRCAHPTVRYRYAPAPYVYRQHHYGSGHGGFFRSKPFRPRWDDDRDFGRRTWDFDRSWDRPKVGRSRGGGGDHDGWRRGGGERERGERGRRER